MSIAILIISFVIFLIIGIPIAVCIGAATMLTMLTTMDAMPAFTTMAQRMSGGLNSFSLLAIPLFILSGHLMGQGGIATRLIEFAKSLIGMLPGGLALVNIVSCTLFGAISGSAVAATSAIGSFMMPEMKKQGYDDNFNAAITGAASVTGLLIPPSNILIVYAVASGGVSIAALFVAGYLPGLLLSAGLMMVCLIYAKKNNFPRGERVPARIAFQKTIDALPSLFLIFLIIGGIIGGAFTATEAGAIAVIYSLILSVFVYKEVPLKKLGDVLLKSAGTTAIVMFLIATSIAMSWILAYQNIPEAISVFLLTLSDNPIAILLLINIALLVIGAFMDMTPAVLIFTPIFLPVAEQMGISPLHFGIIMILNLSIGLCTPPVGSVLFVACAIAKTSITSIIKPLLPLFVAMLAVLLLVTYFPFFSEALPRFFGLI